MKLKKIASLAMAGILAVSMLAGCAGKDNTTTVPTTPTESASVADTFNEVAKDELDGNDVQITFTYDAALAEKLTSVLETAGKKNTHVGDVAKNVLDPKVSVNSIADFNGSKNGTSTDPQTVIYVETDETSKTDEQFVKSYAEKLFNNTKWDDLKAEYSDAANKIDYTYDYEGTISLVKVEEDGLVTRYLVVTVTCDTSKALA